MGCAPTNHARRTVPYGRSKLIEDQESKSKAAQKPKQESPVKQLITSKKQVPKKQRPPQSSPLPKAQKVRYAEPLKDIVIKQENRSHKVNCMDFGKKEHFLPV